MDYFGARYYSSTQGRFTSPDEPFADQDANDPQSWNLYAYTSNSPLNRVDPDGERWFYKCGGNNGCDVQWVNPNEDGTYTSPGEGWKEFVPTKERPLLLLYSQDGRKAHYFGENPDGSPRAESYWTGGVSDASWDIVGLFIPARLTAKGILAGASALWARHVAQKAAKEAAKSAAERLVNLGGKSRAQARELLEQGGFKRLPNTKGGYEQWSHSDGSKVWVRPNGEVVRTGPKVTPEGGGKKYAPRIGPDGKRTQSHNTGEKVDQ